MPKYGPEANEQTYGRLRTLLLAMAAEREFDAKEALVRAISEGVTNNAGTVAAVLDDLDDLGYLTKRQESGPARFRMGPNPPAE